MTIVRRFENPTPGITRFLAIAALVMTLIMLTAGITQFAQAQNYAVLHSFTGGNDGDSPYAGLSKDAAGNLYGTTVYGGAGGSGVVFKLAHVGSGWVLNPLYTFQGTNDGGNPVARVIFGRDGSLYGTTWYGAGGICSGGSGIVFNLRPPPNAPRTALTPWTETVLYRFTGGTDGCNPGYGDLVFDQAGNIYGTTVNKGADYYGVVFELIPSGGGWTEQVLYAFAGGSDGQYPFAGVTFDQAGNLDGTTLYGGLYHLGTVYQLTPSGSGWTEQVLTSFLGLDHTEGELPVGGVILDAAGNLYGTTAGPGGTVYEMMPNSGGWSLDQLWYFPGESLQGSWGSLIRDRAGNLYGTTRGQGTYGSGSVFKLTPSDGGWTETDLYDFTGGNDGAAPYGNVIFDAQGNLYGTTSAGGAYNAGVVFEITP